LITSVIFHFHFLSLSSLHHHYRATSQSVVRGTLRGQCVQATLQVTMTRGRWSCGRGRRGVGLVGASAASGGVGLISDVLRYPVLDFGPVVQVGQLLGLGGVSNGVVIRGARATTDHSGPGPSLPESPGRNVLVDVPSTGRGLVGGLRWGLVDWLSRDRS
jgi:hypothetical protein